MSLTVLESGWLRARGAIAIEDDCDAECRPDASGGTPALLLGYGQMPEPAIRAGVHELAQAIHAARRRVPRERGRVTP